MSSPPVPAEPTRPTTVSVAYWVWLVAAVAAVVTGVFLLTVPRADLRTLLVTLGVVNMAAGLGIGYCAARVRAGEPRFRRALVALSVGYAFFAILQALAGVVGLVLLVAALLLFAAVALVTTPSARPWFDREAG